VLAMVPSIETSDGDGGFSQRPSSEQEAILLNIYCEVCRRVAKTPYRPIEIHEQDRITVEATCFRCGNRVRVSLSDIP
jgi:hypothetical protein